MKGKYSKLICDVIIEREIFRIDLITWSMKGKYSELICDVIKERQIFRIDLWFDQRQANINDLINDKQSYQELINDLIKDWQILMTWSMINKYRELICKLIFRRFWVRVWGFDTMSGQHQVMYHLINQSIK